MYWYQTSPEVLRPRFYVSGMPKTGLNLFTLMVNAVCEPYDPAIFLRLDRWVGGLMGNSFTRRLHDQEYELWAMSLLPPGFYCQGHCPWYQEMDSLLKWSGIGHVFIVRDWRDVAVSQAYHIFDDSGERFHMGRDAYRLLGGMDEVLKAVIVGMGPFPGVMDRWADYAPWLESEHTLVVRYEDAVADPQAVAEKILEHGLDKVQALKKAGTFRVERTLFDKAVKGMVKVGQQTDLSPTFRKGKPGEWRETFTEEHKDLFKETDSEGWLVKLAFEDEEDW